VRGGMEAFEYFCDHGALLRLFSNQAVRLFHCMLTNEYIGNRHAMREKGSKIYIFNKLDRPDRFAQIGEFS
jgi:hypothetical protein